MSAPYLTSGKSRLVCKGIEQILGFNPRAWRFRQCRVTAPPVATKSESVRRVPPLLSQGKGDPGRFRGNREGLSVTSLSLVGLGLGQPRVAALR